MSHSRSTALLRALLVPMVLATAGCSEQRQPKAGEGASQGAAAQILRPAVWGRCDKKECIGLGCDKQETCIGMGCEKEPAKPK
jgi:hypothetical protein